MKLLKDIKIGIIGGSGFYELLEDAKEFDISTEYGKPSDKVMIGEYQGVKVAFIPRHGRKHTIPPHKINYRANIKALHDLGVQVIISPCASGSLTPKFKPGDFVILDQFIDRTHGRIDTFFDGPEVKHTTMADPYSKCLRNLAYETCQELKIKCHNGGTVVVIQGPRFSSKAESRWFANQSFEVINMTQYPEVALALEFGMCYVGMAIITDYDAGLEGREDIVPVTEDEVIQVFEQNKERVKRLVLEMVKKITSKKCPCKNLDK